MVRYSPKRKLDVGGLSAEEVAGKVSKFGGTALVGFVDAENIAVGCELAVPLSATKTELLDILKTYFEDEDDRLDNYSLVLAEHGIEVTETLEKALAEGVDKGVDSLSTETTLKLAFYSTASFRIRPVARLSGSLSGHKGPIVCASFSGDGSMLATGSGDCCVRLWDLHTATPIVTLEGHTRSVVTLAWSPCARFLASGSEDKKIRVFFNPEPVTATTAAPTAATAAEAGGGGIGGGWKCVELSGHLKTITSLAWMPAHLSEYWVSEAPLLASASEDGGLKVWDVIQGNAVYNLDGHSKMITSVRWSGLDGKDGKGENANTNTNTKLPAGPYLYTSSRDMSIRMWSVSEAPNSRGVCVRHVKCHGHWVNSLSLNTDMVMRYGAFAPNAPKRFSSVAALCEAAALAWQKAWKNLGEERVVTCSDDNTLALYNLHEGEKRRAHMTGHQKSVCHAVFSPNGRFIVSGGFDSALRLWDGRSGKFLHTYRGHVGPVYQVAFSPDSRFVVSGSADSTVKVWDTAPDHRKKIKHDLPGHADEVYAVDWSPQGDVVCSAGKDKVLRLWSH